MRFGVISYNVAARGDFLGQAGTFADAFADEKESGFGAVTVEKVKELWSDGGIGAVVKGDSEFARLGGLENGVSEELRARVNRAKRGRAGNTHDDRGGNEPGIHRPYHRTEREYARAS